MQKLRILSALIVAALIVFQMPARGADKNQKLLFEKSFPTELGERLKLNSIAGDVKINSWCKNEVKIRIYGSFEAGKYLDFRVSSDALGIKINALKKAGIENVKNLNLRYEICVPHNYGVKVSSRGKKVNVENPNGPVKLSSPGGE